METHTTPTTATSVRLASALDAPLEATMALADATWSAGDLQSAFTLLRRAVHLGDPHALLNLGYFHDEGLGRPRSKHDAMRCYQRAARHGISAAATNAAVLHRERGHLRSMCRWFCRGARMGDGDAHFDLARCYRDGDGMPKWRSRAIVHARRAARSTLICEAGRNDAKTLLMALRTASRPALLRIGARR
jgi:TPR repeat protein